jgi:hypothetical protein
MQEDKFGLTRVPPPSPSPLPTVSAVSALHAAPHLAGLTARTRASLPWRRSTTRPTPLRRTRTRRRCLRARPTSPSSARRARRSRAPPSSSARIARTTAVRAPASTVPPRPAHAAGACRGLYALQGRVARPRALPQGGPPRHALCAGPVRAMSFFIWDSC